MEILGTMWFGIILLVIFAIGLASILLWVVKQVVKLFKPQAIRQDGSSAPATFIRVGHGRVLTNINDLPQYKGRVGLFGLPVYKDVIVPDKHNYATVVYMDTPVKQWVYDVMASWKGFCNGIKKGGEFKTAFVILFFPVMIAFTGVSILKILIGMAVIFILLYLWYIPSGMTMTRRSAELSKNVTPEQWDKIYLDVLLSKEREDEMVRAFRRSGHW